MGGFYFVKINLMKSSISLLFLRYLRFLARLQLRKNPQAIIVGITGSAGKTSTLLACEAALKNHFKVKSNSGSNSESGIPLSILGLKVTDFSFFDWLKIALLAPIKLLTNWEKYEIYLVEMGIDSAAPPKNMEYLLSIIQPQIAIFLNVTSVHQQNFSSLDQIAAEKAKLANTAQIAIINPDDSLVVKYTTNPHRLFIKPLKITYRHPLPSIYHLSFGAASTLANHLGLDSKTITNNLGKYFKLPPSRSTILRGLHHSIIIDSSYNSSPLAAKEMLDFLKTYPSFTRRSPSVGGPRIAILGDMRELGSASPTTHQELYQTALKSADILISVGPETTKYFGQKSRKFTYWWQASDYLQSHPELVSGSHILIKGSQNTIYLEELVKSFLKNPSDAKLLCRQSPYWLKTKEKFKNSYKSDII